MTSTWMELVGKVSIFLDGKWNDAILHEIRPEHVVYSLCKDNDKFVMAKDEAYSIIRPRNIVSATSAGKEYNGKNPLIFGPAGTRLYGKKITARKDRPNVYRVEVTYQTQQYAKPTKYYINLGRHVSVLILLHFAVCLFV